MSILVRRDFKVLARGRTKLSEEQRIFALGHGIGSVHEFKDTKEEMQNNNETSGRDIEVDQDMRKTRGSEGQDGQMHELMCRTADEELGVAQETIGEGGVVGEDGVETKREMKS